MSLTELQDRYTGCVLGLAAGDALGTTLEFKPPGSFEPISDLVGGGPFGLEPGQWTDDTSMALCLAESPGLPPEPLVSGMDPARPEPRRRC
jgi:ADP-ribosylglycohydrolase